MTLRADLIALLIGTDDVDSTEGIEVFGSDQPQKLVDAVLSLTGPAARAAVLRHAPIWTGGPEPVRARRTRDVDVPLRGTARCGSR